MEHVLLPSNLRKVCPHHQFPSTCASIFLLTAIGVLTFRVGGGVCHWKSFFKIGELCNFLFTVEDVD